MSLFFYSRCGWLLKQVNEQVVSSSPFGGGESFVFWMGVAGGVGVRLLWKGCSGVWERRGAYGSREGCPPNEVERGCEAV